MALAGADAVGAAFWTIVTDAGRLTAALEGRYTIERELGAGGMATVFRGCAGTDALPLAYATMMA